MGYRRGSRDTGQQAWERFSDEEQDQGKRYRACSIVRALGEPFPTIAWRAATCPSYAARPASVSERLVRTREAQVALWIAT